MGVGDGGEGQQMMVGLSTARGWGKWKRRQVGVKAEQFSTEEMEVCRGWGGGVVEGGAGGEWRLSREQ